MSQSMRRLILVALATYVGCTQGLLVVGPKYIRSNQEYKMVITNFNASSVYLRVRMEGYTDAGENILNLSKERTVRGNLNLLVGFKLPNLIPGNYKITMDGKLGFSFHKEVELEFVSKSISGLIQLDKPVYKPGDSVQFRVIVLDTELKPPANVKSVNVAIKDPRGNVIRDWAPGRLHVGVFEAELVIALTPLLGIWNISVIVEGEELVSKTFEVKEYVLSTFDVDVSTTTVPLEEHGGLNLTISAKNVFGQPVRGNVHLIVFSTESLLEVKATRQVDGVAQLGMRFNRPLHIHTESEEVNLNFTFTEQYTNRSIAKSLQFTVYKTKYTAKLNKDTPLFLPGKTFTATVKVEHRDGSAARYVHCTVEAYDLKDPYKRTFVTDENGQIHLELMPSESDTISITVLQGENTILEEEIQKAEQNTEAFFDIAFNSGIQPPQNIKLRVTCRRKVQFLVYYVIAKGNLIHQGFERFDKTSFDITIKYADNMVPKAKVLVVTVTNNIVVYGIKDIVFPGLLNNFEMELEDDVVKPGQQIQLEIGARPFSYVALAAYDKSLLQYGSTHDLYWSDVQQLYESFHRSIDEKQFDVFENVGLFARISDDLRLDEAQGFGRNGNVQKRFTGRTNFAESFLWRNVTLDRSGRYTLIADTPETTTAWCLTGFSVHPTYGLGIIRNPLQLNTVKAFYIVDHLPYSIKRGEVITLQFTIFNNLGEDFLTQVSLENVQDQMEFVEQPTSTSSSSKMLTVKEGAAAPVSFLVKAKKLGELVVRVKALNMITKDAIEKVIRVLPESLVEKKMDSHMFCHDSHLKSEFTYNLNMDEKADPGSQKITFKINPNLIATVATDLGELLSVPTGCGEQNMIRFVPNVVVLDYLKATESNELKLMEKATSLLRQGYQSQMKYYKEDGSFGVWQEGGGSVFLTAFVAKSMQTAAKHISEVNVTMVARAFEWLASKQQSNGRFNEVGEVIHSDMQGGLRNEIALTSYVLIAFMEHEEASVTHAGVIAKGIAYVASMLSNVSDLYHLAIATYALMLNNHYMRDQYLQTLVDRSTSIGQMRYWAREPHGIETTAYALLAMVQAGKYRDGIPVMRWLANQRYVTGSFPRTQDTFVGLKALTKVGEKISPSRNDYTVVLQYAGKQDTFTVSSINTKAQTLSEIPSNVRQITANVEGLGFGLLDVMYEYSLDLRNYSHRFDLKLKKLTENSDDKLQLEICVSYIPQSGKIRSNMALVEVNFPSGYAVDNNPITETTFDNPIKNIEIRFGATSVVAYYDNMGKEENCFVVTAYRRFKVTLQRPAYVLVHDYYDPKLNAIRVYQLDPRDEREASRMNS